MSETFFPPAGALRASRRTSFERLNDREMLVKKLQIIPVETVVRKRHRRQLGETLGLEEGKALPHRSSNTSTRAIRSMTR